MLASISKPIEQTRRKSVMVWSKKASFSDHVRNQHPSDKFSVMHIHEASEVIELFQDNCWAIMVDLASITKEEIENIKKQPEVFKKCIFTNTSEAQIENENNNTVHQNGFLDKEATKSLSPNMISLNNMVAKVAPIDVSVVLQGESGVGKEVFAKRIHRFGPRSKGPWIAVNCPAIPDTLIESELFGHVKGAFTGADARKIGKFELANGGTLFLDEVADFSMECQAKILRVLQEREIEPVGSSKPIPVNIRLICASSKNLRELVEQGRFREDLLYRLADVELLVPSLRDRPDDVELLIPFFTKQFHAETGCPIKSFDVSAIKILQQKSWPGNVRELKSYVRRIMILSEVDIITAETITKHQNLFIKPAPKLKPHDQSHMNEETPHIETMGEKEKIELALRNHHYHVTNAAKSIGMSRASIYRKIKKYDIKVR